MTPNTPVEEDSSESQSLDKLYAALSKAQLEMLPAKTSCNNPFFKSKYADLASIVKASRKALGTNGLAVIQRIIRNGSAGMTLRYNRMLCLRINERTLGKLKKFSINKEIRSWESMMNYQDFSKI